MYFDPTFLGNFETGGLFNRPGFLQHGLKIRRTFKIFLIGLFGLSLTKAVPDPEILEPI